MNVGFLCSEYPPGPHGGIGTVTQVLARALARAGHTVQVAGVYPPDYPGPDREEDQGVQVSRERLPRSRLGWLRERHRLYRQAARWSRSRAVDLIELADWQGPAAFWPRLRVPLIVRVHGSVSYFLREQCRPIRRVDFWLERACLRRADAWCAVSRYVAHETATLFALKTEPGAVLHNPVVVPPAAPGLAARDRNRVMFTGTLAAKKGVIALVDAWPAVRQAAPQAELHLYGKDGRSPAGDPMREHLLARVPPEVRPSLHFHGHVTRAELDAALACARVAVFPSFSESFGLAPLEALAQGCPTIYTRLSCGPEIVRDDIDGLLVDPRQPREIAQAIIRILSDDDLAGRLTETGRRRVAGQFSVERLRERNEIFYRHCLETFRQRAGGNGAATSRS